MLHVRDVRINSRQAVQPMAALEGAGAESHVAAIDGTCPQGHICPCRPRNSVRSERVLERVPERRTFVQREQQRCSQLPREKLSQAALNFYVLSGPPKFGAPRVADLMTSRDQR